MPAVLGVLDVLHTHFGAHLFIKPLEQVQRGSFKISEYREAVTGRSVRHLLGDHLVTRWHEHRSNLERARRAVVTCENDRLQNRVVKGNAEADRHLVVEARVAAFAGLADRDRFVRPDSPPAPLASSCHHPAPLGSEYHRSLDRMSSL